LPPNQVIAEICWPSRVRTSIPYSRAIAATSSGEEGVLEQVLRVVHRPDDPVGVRLELTPVRVVSSRNASSSPARARASTWLVTLASSQRLFLSPASL
jgi:hypothetical protein